MMLTLCIYDEEAVGHEKRMRYHLWSLDYPVLSWLFGLHCYHTYHLIGESVCVARAAPLGRAFVRLQRRWRFRVKAQQVIVHMVKVLGLDEYTAMCIASYFVTIFPRIM